MSVDQSANHPLPPASAVSTLLARVRSSHGARSGLGLALATAILTGGGYLYSVACIRYLGSGRFGDVATMLSLGTLAALPLSGVQNLLARETAHLRAIGDNVRLKVLFRRSLLLATALSIVITAAAMAASAPIGRLVNVKSGAVVAVGLSVIAFFAVAPILYGFVQGMERFRGLGIVYAVSGAARPALVIPALLAGLGVSGALGVNVIAAAIAVGIALYFLRDLWTRGDITMRGPLLDRREIAVMGPLLDRREVAVMVGGTLAFASLTNIDVVLANALLTDEEGGVYAAAALAAKLVLLVSLVVVTVLLPKATSRVAQGRSAVRILLASVAATAALSTVGIAALALVPEHIVVWAFGGDFAGSTSLLGLFGLTMGLAGIVNVYLLFYLAHRDVWFPSLVGAAAIAQIVAVAFWHPSPRGIVLVTLLCAAGLLLIHEAFFPYGVARSVRGLHVARSGIER